MRAKAKFLTVVVLLFSVEFADADETCALLSSMNPNDVRVGLSSFSEILGKPAEFWGEEDFSNLAANAAACNGMPLEYDPRYRVDGEAWRRNLNSAAATVIPVSRSTLAIRQAYQPSWTWGEVPGCAAVLGWKRDSIWMTENSEDVFGKSLTSLRGEERGLVVAFSGECIPVMEKILLANRIPKSRAEIIAADIARSAERAERAERESEMVIAPTLQVEREGSRIPLAYLGEETRKLVLEVNRYELSGRTMPLEELMKLSNWSEKMSASGREGPDAEYAAAIRSIVANHMFKP